ncbi:vanadium-dependent haloperoxidase [Ammoniphilus sp. YIM 78166]|uniref:vanadium-dependent haloperoxidase n=1 Tax=Ammoniphilus sp. YIM 78166 TaxID=1644106 RepID=UPI00106FD8CF|nr:vanadium-dependent haloperoxidase [Ammoniphilus sp. YIM 78166]
MGNLPRWSVLERKIYGRKATGLEPSAGSWRLFYFRRNKDGQLTDHQGKPIKLAIRNPFTIKFRGQELPAVQRMLKHKTERTERIAKYWGLGPPTKQWTPIIERLIDTYGVTPPRAARILAAMQAGINDAFLITWALKYRWDVARPDQLDRSLKTIIPTPKFPGYPSGHSVISGTAQVVLSYFFPAESKRLRNLAEEAALSRLYAGIHFPVDSREGLRLGRQIGRIIVKALKNEKDNGGLPIDKGYTIWKRAKLPPPPYL